MNQPVGLVGADPDELRALSAAFTDAAAELAWVGREVAGSLEALPWQGLRASAFRSRWVQDDEPQLARAATLLDDAAQALRREADEQDAASGAVAGAVGGSSLLGLWEEWDARWKPVDRLVGLAPWLGAALTWRDAPKASYVDWLRHADQWQRANIGGAVGAGLGWLGRFGIAMDAWGYQDAMREGRWADAAEKGTGAAIGLAGLSQVAAVRAAGGVGLAGQAGWAVGSWVHDTWGHTAPMVWAGDHVIGPAGDAVVGGWEQLAGAVGGWYADEPEADRP